MPSYAIALFDADGVLAVPSEPFSFSYSRSRGLDPEHAEPFFAGDFQRALRGEADLKDLIKSNHDIWGWDDDPQLLLDQWFAAENHPNTELLDYIQTLRAKGIKCYLATDQEKYRQKYLEEVMFAGKLDGVLASNQFGHVKKEPAYFKKVLERLHTAPEQIIYFDDSQRNLDSAEQSGIETRLYTKLSDVTQSFI
jgi:putative hydrolase of the HAD superfamily